MIFSNICYNSKDYYLQRVRVKQGVLLLSSLSLGEVWDFSRSLDSHLGLNDAPKAPRAQGLQALFTYSSTAELKPGDKFKASHSKTYTAQP